MDVVMVTKGCTSCPHSGKVLVKNSVIKVLVLACSPPSSGDPCPVLKLNE